MARVTVEDCLEQEDNRFALVVLAARRTRQLMKGSEPLVKSNNKFSVVALREISEYTEVDLAIVVADGQIHSGRDVVEIYEDGAKPNLA